MKIVIATDKFKGSLNSFDACAAIARGLQRVYADPEIVSLPLSDGGDGLADVLAFYSDATQKTTTVSDPLGRSIDAKCLVSKDGNTAIIEMAQASGLQRLQPHEYNPLQTSTFGTGELLKQAITQGVSKIILGIGGSATNDCGIGMAAALGYRFLDAAGKELKPVGENLAHIHSINKSRVIDFSQIQIEVACDVTNVLTGATGAAKTYAAQKGATPEMIAQLEAGALHFAAIAKKEFGNDLLTLTGGGAAGGLGAGCVLFLNAQLRSGVDLVLQQCDAERQIATADLVITGEGKLDAQSLHGKVVHGVASLCKKHNKPLIALCGTLDVAPAALYHAGISAAFSIIDQPMDLQTAQANAAAMLETTAQHIGNFSKPHTLPNNMKPKIIVLDGVALNSGDLTWDAVAALGALTVHDRTAASDVVVRSKEAQIIITNKTPVIKEVIEQLPALKLITVLATGYNIVDVDAAKARGVVACNVPTYGTDSVAQHAFSLLLELTNHVGLHAQSVAAGEWQQSPDFAYTKKGLMELAGKTLGIVGFGNIGQQMARIGAAFGMKILYNSRTKKETDLGTFVDLETVFAQSDVVSLHCPLTPENKGFVNSSLLQRMKPTAFLLNTARGPLINETDLAEALNNDRIAGAGLDVLSEEPPKETNPLLHSRNCIITPHIAWMSFEARQRIMQVTAENIRAFQDGKPVNVVNP